ncbi:hypothetical protein KC921_03530 [Candidatus Woesebacteria bacterium]|nr:hypothetical protein [Candidatus Woesebacteria bacterium]
MQQILIAASVFLASLSSFVYFIAILRGQAKPHRTTRLVFLVITTLTTLSLLAQGNQVAVWLSGISTLQSMIIFGLSIKYGMGGWSKLDIFCLLTALAGIAAWQLTKNPLVALYFAIGADFIGILPTIIKTYHFPKTEVWTFYFLDVCAGICNVMATQNLVFDQYLYPVYIIAINLVMVFLVVRPSLARPKKS